MSWRKTITDSSAPASWRDTVQDSVSEVESGLRGAAQGATFGFSDEITGGIEALWEKAQGSPEEFGRLYAQSRDESRSNNRQAQDANPLTYGAGEIGGAVGTAFIPGLGALNAVKGASLAARAGLGATQGALTGAGLSNADSVSGLAKDAAIGGVVGGAMPVALSAMGKVGGYVADKVRPAFENLPGKLNRGLAKVGSIASGADEDALLRNIERPYQMAAAESDGFANKLSQQAMDEVQMRGQKLGSEVGSAKLGFLKKSGDAEFENIGNDIASRIDDFVAMNAPSQKGFSGLSTTQSEELGNLYQTFKGGNLTGEDLVKSREYLDYVEKLAQKYDKEGTGPYIGFLKSLRGELDSHLDRISPEIDSANTRFSNFMDDKKILGLNNESTAESIVSNLYGKNKTAKQQAAGQLLKPKTMESIQDIAANKAVAGATGPSGSDFGRRTMLGHVAAIPTFGLSEAVVSPTAWKHGLRTLGKIEDKVGYALKNSPDHFGKYSKPLSDALSRGPAAFAATNFVLSQNDPNYRQKLKDLEDEGR